MPGGRDYVVRRRILRHERRRAGLERAEEVLVAGIHRQHDDPQLRIRRPQLLHRLQTTSVGKADVHDDDIGFGLRGERQRFRNR